MQTLGVLFGAGVASMGNVSVHAQANSGEGFGLEEVVVTARRKDESLQDVPLVVNAVSDETLEKLNILNFADVQAVVPGLNLSGTNTGYSTTASMRGASFSQETVASATVEMYLNDANVDGNFVFQSMYDVGQIEVLRGPQGTLRGRASPSGAITVTTRRPDLADFGGYASATATDQNGTNVQGAFNLPILTDKLAMRVAAVYDENEIDGVRSANSSVDPNQETKSGRVSFRFEPTDAITANLMYQRLDKNLNAFNQVYGAGHIRQAPTEPATGYNGPVIAPGDRLGVTDGARDVSQKTDNVIGQLDWRFAGQKLSYVGSWSKLQIDALAPQDTANLIPGYEFYQDLQTDAVGQAHELRLASEERLFGKFDYTVGAYYTRGKAEILGRLTAGFLRGAFGTPLAAPVVGPPNMRFSLPLTIDNPASKTRETSAFASLTWHVTDQTELTAGARYIMYDAESLNQLLLGSGFIAQPLPVPAICGAIGGQFGATYAGVCDIPIPASTLQSIAVDDEDEPTIYNVSISHRLNDGLLIYANTASSWRAGPTAVGISSLNVATDPVLNSLVFHDPEKSKAYEIGFKSTFLEGRGRANLAVYHQTFDGFLYYTPQSINYLQVTPTGSSRAQANFTANADAVVDGVDLDTALRITPNWDVTLSASYTDAKVDDDFVPCNDSNLDGVADTNPQTDAQFIATMQAAGQSVALCKSDVSINRFPEWSTSLQSEYFRSLTPKMDGYVRGLWTYYPENDRTDEGGIRVENYDLLNLYVGLRDPEGVWEVSLFGKNIANNRTMLSGGGVPVSSAAGLGGFFGNSGYFATSFTPRREFGVNFRYAFGSR